MSIDGFEEEALAYLKTDLNLIANCIGYEMFKDRVKVKENIDGVSKIWLEEEDIDLVYATSRRILKEMIIDGWSKVNSVCNCGHNNGNCSRGKFNNSHLEETY